MNTTAAATFLASRDFLLNHRTDYETAVHHFKWPVQQYFNWALDYFDTIAADNAHPALHIVEEDGTEAIRSFAELSVASNRVANFLGGLGARKGDRLLLMLGNEVATVFEPASDGNPACYAQGKLSFPDDASSAAVRVRIILPEVEKEWTKDFRVLDLADSTSSQSVR